MQEEKEESRLIKGDCLEVHKEIGDKSIDLILTDLPYGVTRNDWDSKVDLDELWKDYKRVIKDRGVIVLFGQGMFTKELMASNMKMWRYNLIWDKCLPTGFLNANRQPMRVHEDIVIFYKKAPMYNPQKVDVGYKNNSKGNLKKARAGQVNNNYGEHKVVDNRDKLGTERFPTSILKFAKPHPSRCNHPTEKPIELLRYIIRTFTEEGMVVLDSTMGSGSTCVAAEIEGRRYIGIEKEEEYYCVAKDRVGVQKGSVENE